jgi:hypothetical protein
MITIQRVAWLLAFVTAGFFTGILASPASAEQLNVASARQFVLGKLFAFNCFEGTRGAGRVYGDGSVSGTVQFSGRGPIRYVTLPAGTIKTENESVCASVQGMPIQPCFNLDKTDPQSFRGSISGLGFAYCDFTKRMPKTNVLRTLEGARTPMELHAAAASAGEQ